MGNPIVLITGGLAGIGRATAIAFARSGASVVVAGRRADAGKALAAELRAYDVGADFVLADVRHEDDARRMVDQVVSQFGRIDIAVNSAGTEGAPGPVTDVSVDGYQSMFETNVLGVLLSMKYELKAMQGQGSGSIVNVSSTMGERGAPNMSLYAGSKHAVEGITKSAALEAVAYGVRVNAVAPGPTETAMLERLTGSAERKAAFVSAVPMKRGGKPEQIADAILFMASDKAAYVTGQILRVNGGKTAS